MRWNQKRRLVISLPLAILAALAMVAINEIGFQRSIQALDVILYTQQSRSSVEKLTSSVLEAEAGLKSYFLTNDERHLNPYHRAIFQINGEMDGLREIFISDSENFKIFSLLSGKVAKKNAEMDLSLRLFKEGKEEAWKFIVFTDADKSSIKDIKNISQKIIERNEENVLKKRENIQSALWLSRLGIATVTVIGLLAFYMYLRQAHMLQDVYKREQKIQSEERSRLEDLVRDRTATLSELANHLQQVREDERGHLARELHDELGSLLTAAKLDVARLKSRIDMSVPEVAERIMHLTENLNSGIALKRRIIEDLRPSSLSNLGLTTALEILTREFAQRSEIDVQSSLEQVDLSEATQLTVYRIIQESLTNIGKYAGAAKVVVSVHKYPTYVAVQIQDNGCGFDLKGIKSNSHGLAGMKHRVEAAGGRLVVVSALGEGTSFSAVIPLTESKKSGV